MIELVAANTLCLQRVRRDLVTATLSLTVALATIPALAIFAAVVVMFVRRRDYHSARREAPDRSAPIGRRDRCKAKRPLNPAEN